MRTGGRWYASGVAYDRAYELEGQFLKVDAPRTLVHTWHGVGASGAQTTVTYRLKDTGAGTRLTLTHAAFASSEVCENTRAGWETSLPRSRETAGAGRIGNRRARIPGSLDTVGMSDGVHIMAHRGAREFEKAGCLGDDDRRVSRLAREGRRPHCTRS